MDGFFSQLPHKCHPILVAFAWELTNETIYLPLGCLQGGEESHYALRPTTSIINTRWSVGLIHGTPPP